MNPSEFDKKVDLGPNFSLFSGILLLFSASISLVFLAYLIVLMLNHEPNKDLIQSAPKPYASVPFIASNSDPYPNLWKAPSINSIPDGEMGDQIKYGRELIINTSKYFGPRGSIAAGSTNGLNCQNCHLQAGTAAFGNNYGAVAATYPQVRPRSEKPEDIPFRINDCFERSLNGKALALNSKEMKAIVAYMEWLGKDVPKGKAPEGSGLIKLPYLNRAADPIKGKLVYENQCLRCHGANGEGKMLPDGISYEYPPLWGDKAYNVSAGLFRLEKMARFLKANMPYGVTYEKPKLSDEEAWDVAAFINSMPHPMKKFPQDWPNLLTKGIDVPFGPYADGFNEEQHKYGPYQPIIEKMKSLKKNN
jgi:thiosulfate dehydrogenase